VISPGNLARVSEVSREQEYIGRLYERVDVLRDGASAGLALALRQDGGTAQSRLDRDAAVFRHGEQLARLDAAEDGLCFGRLDLVTGERRHIGRIGLRDASGEGEPLLIDWRACPQADEAIPVASDSPPIPSCTAPPGTAVRSSCPPRSARTGSVTALPSNWPPRRLTITLRGPLLRLRAEKKTRSSTLCQ
jgi:hypothetical protein